MTKQIEAKAEQSGPRIIEVIDNWKKIRAHFNVGIVDDARRDIEGIGELLTVMRPKVRPIGFLINGYVQPGEMQQRAGATIIRQHSLDAFIVDKGLGYFNSFDLIRELRDEGFPTIMNTAEPGTRESHRVADRYVEKHGDPQDLLNTVAGLLRTG